MNEQVSLSKIIEIQKNPKLKKMNLGCGQDVRPHEEGWLNVDAISHPSIRKLNIFDIPYNIESNTFDYILARHVLEHVPHNIDKYGYAKNFMQLFMEEIWRLMKEGAILDIEVPSGISSIAKAIDHKRIITPDTFHIFFSDSKWNYYTDCRFEVIYTSDESLKFKMVKYMFRKFLGVDVTYLRPGNNRFCLRKLSKNN
jgi:hypothetical protein